MKRILCFLFLTVFAVMTFSGCITTTVVGGSIGWLFPSSEGDYTPEVTKDELKKLYDIADDCWNKYEEEIRTSESCSGMAYTHNSAAFTDNKCKIIIIAALTNNVNISSISKKMINKVIATYVGYSKTYISHPNSNDNKKTVTDIHYSFKFYDKYIEENLLGQIELSEIYINAIEED